MTLATPLTSRQRFLAALRGEPLDRVPVFPLLMGFAARRAGLSYRDFASSGTALAEAQMRVQRRFHLDAITVCSDAYRVSADLGGEMAFPLDTPPHLTRPLVTSAADVARLGHPDPTRGRMGDRVHGVATLARSVGDTVAVLGWVDMPFAEACCVCGVEAFLILLYEDPALAHAILERVTPTVIAFAQAQVAAGALMIGAGDAAASLISPDAYREFALPYERRVCAAVHQAGALVKLHICGNTTALLPDMAGLEADLFNVDHLVPFPQACQVYGAAHKAFKGNLDPVTDLLYATPEQCRARARACLDQARGRRYLLSPGCEVPADTPDAVFEAFCGAVTDVAAE